METRPILNADVLEIIFKDLNIHDLLSALLVNRLWCQEAVPNYWKAPFSYKAKRSISASKTYELFLEQENHTVSTLYDYPSFLKELNFTNLLATFDKYQSFTKINAILRMLTKHGVRLESFTMDNAGTNNDRLYGSWAAAEYASIFSSLVFVKIDTPFQKDNVVKSLAKNCTRLSHLDINLYDNEINRVEASLSSLQELISVQTCLLSLRLVFAKGPGKRLVEILRSHSERFKHLELVKWNFDGCAWTWLSHCPNLIEFAITNEPPEKVRGVLGTNYKPYRLKMSKNSKVTTAHWHLGVDDDDDTFYFHPDESSLEPYGDKPTAVVQPKVSRRTNDPQKLKYIYSSLMNKMFEDIFTHDSDSDSDFDYHDHDYDDYDPYCFDEDDYFCNCSDF